MYDRLSGFAVALSVIMACPERIYFDQSILGGLITCNVNNSISKEVAEVGLFLVKNFGKISWGLTPAGLIELLGIKIPYINIEVKSLSLNPMIRVFEIKELAERQYQNLITEQYISIRFEERLRRCSNAIYPFNELGFSMLHSYKNESELNKLIWGTLAWHYLLKFNSDNKEFNDCLLFAAFESLCIGQSIDFYRLGDRLYWKSQIERNPLLKKLKKIGKIEENKDLFDSELLQLALLGPYNNSAGERAVIVTRDVKYLKLRLLRAAGFFDFLFGVAKNSDLINRLPKQNLGRILTFEIGSSNLEEPEEVCVRNFLTSYAEQFNFTPKYFSLGYHMPSFVK